MMTLARRRKARQEERAGTGMPVALGYCRVSTAEQARTGASLPAQLLDLQAKADAEGWLLLPFREEGVSGKSLDRPQMNEALRMLADGEADILLSTAIDRISRDVHDYSGLIKQSQAEGWKLVTLRENIDTTTPDGVLMAHVQIAFAENERKRIGARVKRGMAHKRDVEGKHVGRRTALAPELLARIRADRDGGATWQAIADHLMTEGVPTATGASLWRVSTVQAAYRASPPVFSGTATGQ